MHVRLCVDSEEHLWRKRRHREGGEGGREGGREGEEDAYKLWRSSCLSLIPPFFIRLLSIWSSLILGSESMSGLLLLFLFLCRSGVRESLFFILFILSLC